MPRDKGAWDRKTYESTRKAAEEHRSATWIGEQSDAEGKPLDKHVDPASHDFFRECYDFRIADETTGVRRWLLQFGIALPVCTHPDTTGSMGHFVDLALEAIPKNQRYLVQGEKPLLARYNAQFNVGIIQDRKDKYPFLITEFEPDNVLEQQMTNLVPEREGYDVIEDYLASLWYQAYRVKADIWKYGLKGYSFIIGDAPGRTVLEAATLRKMHYPDPQEIDADSIINAWLSKWHGYFLVLRTKDYDECIAYWSRMLGKERMIELPSPNDIPEAEAVLIGLSEGAFDLKGAREYLLSMDVSTTRASAIVRACAHIPTRAQADLPGFDSIPLKGAVYAKKTDRTPIGSSTIGPIPDMRHGKDRDSDRKADDFTWL